MSWRSSLLATCKILGRFVDTLTVNDKYSLLNRDNLTQPIQMHLSQKQQTFSEFFNAFLKFSLNVQHFQQKMTLIVMYFRNYRLENTWLDNCLQGPVSELLSTGNMVNGQKNCCDLHESTFTIFIGQCESNWVRKSLC